MADTNFIKVPLQCTQIIYSEGGWSHQNRWTILFSNIHRPDLVVQLEEESSPSYELGEWYEINVQINPMELTAILD